MSSYFWKKSTISKSIFVLPDEIEDAKEAQSTKRRKIPFIFPDFVIFLAGEISLYLRVLIAFRPSLLSVLQLCISLFLEGVRLICNLGQWFSRSLVKKWFITLLEFSEWKRNPDKSPRSKYRAGAVREARLFTRLPRYRLATTCVVQRQSVRLRACVHTDWRVSLLSYYQMPPSSCPELGVRR